MFCLAAVPPTGDTSEIQLLPRGWVKSTRGEFLVDDESVATIMLGFDAKKNDLVVDYEHQTLKDMEAPAAGWITRLIDKGAEGLWAEVNWNKRAQEYLANREYRYISPVVLVRKSDKRAVALHSAGLTNTPAIDGMVPLAAKDVQEEEGQEMEVLKAIREKLGLAAEAKDEEVLAALDQLSAASGQIVAHKELLVLLDLAETASLADAKAKLLAFKNPSGYVKAEEFNALRDKLLHKERDELVDEAIRAGKVTPAQKAWAETYALKDPEGFRAFVQAAPAVVPVGPSPAAGTETKPGEALDETQLSINKMLGISDDTFKKHLA